jgi:hypothetical protein
MQKRRYFRITASRKAEGRVLCIKGSVQAIMHFLISSSSLVPWLPRLNPGAHVHLTRRPAPTTSSQACVGMTMSRYSLRSRRSSRGRLSRWIYILSPSWACSVCPLSPLNQDLHFSVLISPSDLLSFLVSACAIAALEVSTIATRLQDRSYVSPQ